MPDAQLLALRCPDCGATVSADGKDLRLPQEIACTFCGHHFVYEPATPAPAPAPVPPAPVAPWAEPLDVPALTPSRRPLIFDLWPVAIPIVAIAVVFWPQSPGQRVSWDHYGGSPIVVSIAGAEAVCGRIRDSGDDALSIRCFDARAVRTRWSFGGLGTYSDAREVVHFAAAGDRIAVTGPKPEVHLLDAESGREQGHVALTDFVARLCVAGAHAIHAVVADGNDVMIDVDTATATPDPAARASCPDPDAPSAARAPPTLAGFSAVSVATDGDVGVASGYKVPGTGYPMAVGFDPATRAIRWSARIGGTVAGSVQASALASGRYVGAYQASKGGWRLAALDPRTGAPQWDAPLRVVAGVGAIVIGGGFVYVERADSLDVVDAADGRLLGVIGDEQ